MIDDQPVYQAAVPHWLMVAAGGGVWLVLLGIRRSFVVRKRAGVP
ncbi:MAG: hypothetical protein JWO82_2058 [Akkermansiaceae bacterium]|nr:hypothetical protein [Akkermansiaceae bacterium]